MTDCARITASEVARLAGYSLVTLGRRVAQGKMPKPVDKARERLFDRRAVYKALGIPLEPEQHSEPEDDNPWDQAANAYAQRQAAKVHGRKEQA